ncbi:hypothetical protein DYB37_001350 [Aphanomyces astaci]|uniref:SAM domain-containing protein n=7 Tax=Aphanomyces astaci TaxID=112090 RepID=A0A397C8K7_APHAT|nr:hypothetical protein DYB30_004025 [Aphanomyces astaci]RHY89973.1 hypothetical protein DYB35_004558 [Aphanomyces astaci]RHZ20634.1 hypothetical protein DYB37_001350 [Aphanomyces astaci]
MTGDGGSGSDPALWSPSQVVVWMTSFEEGRYAPLVTQLKSFSGRQLLDLTEPQWVRVQPTALASSLRYTLLGMHQVATAAPRSSVRGDSSTLGSEGNYLSAGSPRSTTTSRKNKKKQKPTSSIPPCEFPPMLARPSWIVIVFVLLLGVGAILVFVVFKDKLVGTQWDTKRILTVASIPLISVVFTYGHIWLALYMTFYPLEYVGIMQFPGTNMGVCGWQGIVPFKGEKMARMSVRIMTSQLLDVREVFSRIDPAQVVKELEPILFSTIKDIVETMANKYNPSLWRVLPTSVKDEIVEKVKEDAPVHIEALMGEIKHHIDDVFDLEDMVVTHMMKDKQLLVNMFVTCGYQELAFIRDSGATMGFIFGLLQMGLYLVWPSLTKYVTFPVFGLLVGTLTNWLALKMIFEPVNPKKILCIKLHGLFLRRQQQVAAMYGEMVSRDVLNAHNIIEAILKGPASDRLFELVYANVQQAVNSGAAVADRIVSIGIGKDTFESIKDDITDLVVQKFPDSLRHIEAYTMVALDLNKTLREKIGQLSFHDFERLLHPVFEEDEWKLVLMGGVLGLALGFIQTTYEPDHAT